MTRLRMMVFAGLVLTAFGCSSPLTTREKGALAGGAIGAGTGAIIGSQVGHTGAGALIGAGVGAVSGAVIGDAIQGAEQKKAAQPPPVVIAAPPPPVSRPPRLIWVPEWEVYVVEDNDVVYYNGGYYYFLGGRWHVSQSYAGPWVVIATAPPVFAKLPRGQFHAHLPPGLAKKGKIPPGHMR